MQIYIASNVKMQMIAKVISQIEYTATRGRTLQEIENIN